MASAINFDTEVQRIQFENLFLATVSSSFSPLSKASYETQKEVIGALTEEREAVPPEADDRIQQLEALGARLSKANKIVLPLEAMRVQALTRVTALLGQVAVTELTRLHGDAVNAVIAANDALGWLDILKTYWAHKYPPKSRWAIRIGRVQTEPDRSLSCRHRLTSLQINATGTDPEHCEAMHAFLASFDANDITLFKKAEDRLRDADGHAIFNAKNIEELAVLMDRERPATTMKQPSLALAAAGTAAAVDKTGCQVARHANVRSHTVNERQQQRTQDAPGAMCTLNPHHANHLASECHGGKAWTGPPRYTLTPNGRINKTAGARLKCGLCDRGHDITRCPLLEVARSGCINLANHTAAPAASAFATMEQIAFDRLLAVSMAKQQRTAEESAGNEAAARAFIINALSRHAFTEIGVDTLANHRLFVNRSLFIQTTLKSLAEPLRVQGLSGTVSCTQAGSAHISGVTLKDVYYCPSAPLNILSLSELRRQYPT